MANQNFKWNELDPVLRSKLLELEKMVGGLTYASGLRTADYNQEIGGANSSQHLDLDGDGDSMAVDFLRSSFRESPEELIPKLINLGFTGIGIYDKHIHVDVRTNPHERGFSYWDNRTGTGYDKKYNVPVISSKALEDISDLGLIIVLGMASLGMIKGTINLIK